MLDVNGLKEALKKEVGGSPTGASITSVIKSYIMSNGSAKAPTIRYTLAPASGASWATLISKASSFGVSPYIISTWIATEFAGSTKVIPASHGTKTVPMVFDSSAKTGDMSKFTDYDQVWEEISKAIIKFFKPEIE